VGGSIGLRLPACRGTWSERHGKENENDEQLFLNRARTPEVIGDQPERLPAGHVVIDDQHRAAADDRQVLD
jgi:hypothetical protein